MPSWHDAQLKKEHRDNFTFLPLVQRGHSWGLHPLVLRAPCGSQHVMSGSKCSQLIHLCWQAWYREAIGTRGGWRRKWWRKDYDGSEPSCQRQGTTPGGIHGSPGCRWVGTWWIHQGCLWSPKVYIMPTVMQRWTWSEEVKLHILRQGGGKRKHPSVPFNLDLDCCKELLQICYCILIS